MSTATLAQRTFQLQTIGQVRRDDGAVRLSIAEQYRPALHTLDQYSHVIVLWWADHFDNDEGRGCLQCRPPYAEDHVTGVFACRSPLRPNPIALTTCKILGVDEESGLVRVADIDAVDGTPVLDLKAYYPVCDRVKDVRIAGWLVGWPEWMPDDRLGLQPGE